VLVVGELASEAGVATGSLGVEVGLGAARLFERGGAAVSGEEPDGCCGDSNGATLRKAFAT